MSHDLPLSPNARRFSRWLIHQLDDMEKSLSAEKSTLDCAIGHALAQTDLSQRSQPAQARAAAPVATDPHRSVSEIVWAWGWAKAPTDKKVAEELADRLLDALIETLCDSPFGEAVFSLRMDDTWNWSKEDIRKIIWDPYFRGNTAYRAAYLDDWRWRRSNFAQWYNNSYLSAGMPLDSFWPDPAFAVSKSRDRERRSPQPVKREAVERVLAELYSDGIPDPVTLPNKLLCRAVSARLSFRVHDDTILRAADRK